MRVCAGNPMLQRQRLHIQSVRLPVRQRCQSSGVADVWRPRGSARAVRLSLREVLTRSDVLDLRGRGRREDLATAPRIATASPARSPRSTRSARAHRRSNIVHAGTASTTQFPCNLGKPSEACSPSTFEEDETLQPLNVSVRQYLIWLATPRITSNVAARVEVAERRRLENSCALLRE